MCTGGWSEACFGRWTMWAITPGHVLTCHIEWERDTSWLFMAKTSTTDQELSGSQTIAGWIVRLHSRLLAGCDVRDRNPKNIKQRNDGVTPPRLCAGTKSRFWLWRSTRETRETLSSLNPTWRKCKVQFLAGRPDPLGQPCRSNLLPFVVSKSNRPGSAAARHHQRRSKHHAVHSVSRL